MLMRRMKVACSLMALAVAFAAAPPLTRAGGTMEMLELIPHDAWGFAFASSLDRIDAAAGRLKECLGLPMIPDQVSLAALESLNLGDTIDRTSPICAVMMDAQKFVSADKAAVLFVAAKEPKELLERLGAEEAQDGISKCMVMGEPAFAAVKKHVVIIGPDQGCVASVSKSKKTMGKGFAKARLSVLDKSDVYLSLSLRAITNAYKDQFMPIVQMMTAATDPEGKTVKLIVKALTEITALDIALTFDQGGLSMRFLVCPQEDSDMEKLIADQKNTTDPLLSWLPKEKYLLTLGAIPNRSEHADKFSGNSQLASMIKASGTEVDAEAVESLEKELTRLAKTIRRYALSISAMPEGADGLFGLAIVAETDDAKDFVEGLRKAYAAVWKVSDDEEVANIQKAIKHTPDAETISGNKVDTIEVDLNEAAEIAEMDEKDVEHMHMIVGKECVIRFGAADDKRVVVSYGGGEKRYEKICGALKSAEGALHNDSGIADLAGQLPSPRAGEWFLALDSVLQAVKGAAKALGEEEEFPFEVPTINAPLAGSSMVEDKVMRIDFVVPMKLITAAKDAYMQYAATAAEDDFDEDEDDGAAVDEADDTDDTGSKDADDGADDEGDEE